MDELYVQEGTGGPFGVHSHLPGYRKAEVSDLVEALQAEGVGEVRQWPGPITIQPKDRPEIGGDLPPGRYLVVRLEDEHEFD